MLGYGKDISRSILVYNPNVRNEKERLFNFKF